jgi:hypothetical protein
VESAIKELTAGYSKVLQANENVEGRIERVQSQVVSKEEIIGMIREEIA